MYLLAQPCSMYRQGMSFNSRENYPECLGRSWHGDKTTRSSKTPINYSFTVRTAIALKHPAILSRPRSFDLCPD
jgi:hypothetical protein